MSRFLAKRRAKPLPFRELREEAGRTQEEVATALRSNQAAISRFERRTNVEIGTLALYAEALGYHVEVTFWAPGRRTVVYHLAGLPRSRGAVKRR